MLYTPGEFIKQGYSPVEAQNKLNELRNKAAEEGKKVTRVIRDGIVQRLYVG